MENTNKQQNTFLSKKTHRSESNLPNSSEATSKQLLDIDQLHSEVDPPSDTELNPQNNTIPLPSIYI